LRNEKLKAKMASVEALKCASMQSLQECEEHMQAAMAKIEKLEKMVKEKADIIVAKEIEEQSCAQLLATLERYKNEMSRMTAGRVGASSQAQAKLCLPEAPRASGQTSDQANKIPAFLLDY